MSSAPKKVRTCHVRRSNSFATRGRPAEARSASAAVGDQLDQPVAFEQPQRVADRRTREAELLGQGDLLDALAGPQPAQRERSLRTDSGGAGQWRGGLGQTSMMTLRDGPEWRVSALADRTTVPVPGADGGRAGAPGEVSVDGEPLPTKRLLSLEPDAQVRLDLPGGGGVAPRASATRRPCSATSSTAT